MTAKRPDNPPLPWWRYSLWFLVVLFFSWYWMNLGQNQQQQTLSYTAFKEKVCAREVARVTMQGDQVSGGLRQVDTDRTTDAQQAPRRFVTTLPPVDDPELISLLEQHGVLDKIRQSLKKEGG